MPKMKTNRAAAKRLRVTGSGKVKRGKAGKRHLMRGKTRSRLRNLKQGGLVAAVDQHHAERLIPYKF